MTRAYLFLFVIEDQEPGRLSLKKLSPNVYLSKNARHNLIAVGIFLVLGLGLTGLYHLIQGAL